MYILQHINKHRIFLAKYGPCKYPTSNPKQKISSSHKAMKNKNTNKNVRTIIFTTEIFTPLSILSYWRDEGHKSLSSKYYPKTLSLKKHFSAQLIQNKNTSAR